MDATETIKQCHICLQPHHVCRHFEDARRENWKMELELFLLNLKAWLAMMTAPALTSQASLLLSPSLREANTARRQSNPDNQMDLGYASSQQYESISGSLAQTFTALFDWIVTRITAIAMTQNGNNQGRMPAINAGSPEQAEGGREEQGRELNATPLPQQQLIPVARPVPAFIPEATPVADNTPQQGPELVATPVIEAEALPICSITQEVPVDPAQVQPCQHIFSLEAISQWDARHEAGTTPCPNCRTPIQQITPLQVRPQPPRPPSRNPSFSEPRPPSRNPSFSEPRPPSRNPSFGSLAELSMFNIQPQSTPTTELEEDRQASLSM